MLRFLKLTERHDEARDPVNNLALALAFSGVSIVNALMPLMLSGLVSNLHLWR